MNSIQQLLLCLLFAFLQIELAHSSGQTRRHNHHRYTQAIDNNKTATDDDEITNEDTILDITISPPLRLNIYETPKTLSQSGKQAIIKAMNEHATYRLQIYFRDTIYFFDRVEFELLESHTLEREVGTRKLRSFEKEELDTRKDLYREDYGGDEERTSSKRNNDVEFIQSNHAKDGARNLQQKNVMYGTSLLLGGKIKFSLFPSASSADCNEQLYIELQRDWFMHKYITEQNHPELQNVKQWLIGTSKETLAPVPLQSNMPSLRPSHIPSSQPSSRPTSFPTKAPSKPPTVRPTSSPRPTQIYQPSSKPSELSKEINGGNGINENENKPNELKGNILPILIASVLVILFIFALSGMFFLKRRKDTSDHLHKPLGKELCHKRLDDDDDDAEAFINEDGFSAGHVIPTILSTKEESSSMDSDEQGGDEFSEPSAVASSKNTVMSVSSSSTMKMNNVSEKEAIEKKWMAQSPVPASKPPKAPSSTTRSNPVQLNTGERLDDFQKNDTTNENASDHVSPNNISLQVVGAASGVMTAGNSVGPTLMRYFVKSDRGEGARSRTHSRGSSVASSPGRKLSPITNVTPSKVSKEEFEKGWDVSLPLSWNQNGNQRDNDDIENAFNAFNDADGSFPTFGENDQQADRKGAGSSATKHFPSLRSVGDSTAYQSANEMHPLDWSIKGSEYDGTSIGESTFTDGENTASRETTRVSWEGQVNIHSPGGRTPLGIRNIDMNASSQFMTPMTSDFRTPKSTMTDPSRLSGYASSSVCESSPSSRGSSKQLINDLVWLEKKIADVRKRVDRLDVDDSTCSPPRSPRSAVLDRSAASPISHNIVCRDIAAPPGKLNIVIHSTKDGPAIHSVKPGSVLEGQLFKGDLVVAVDDADTRGLNAVDVMNMMAQKSERERKITVIHFDDFEA